MDEVILKNFKGSYKKFNGKKAVIVRRYQEGMLWVRCDGLGMWAKKHQYKEAE